MKKENIKETWLAAKKYWISYIVISIFVLGIFTFSGIQKIGLIQETGNFMLILFDPLVFMIASPLSTLQGVLLFYIAYLLGKNGVNRTASTIMCVAFGLGFTIAYYSVLFSFALVADNPQFAEAVLSPTIFMVLIWTIISAVIYWILHFFGSKQSDEKERTSKNKVEYAGFWVRLAARIIDELVLWAILIIVGIPIMLFLPEELSGAILLIWILMWLLLLQVYFIYFHKKTGQTIGKKVLGIKVVKENFGNLSWTDSIIRWFVENFSMLIFFLGYLWIAIDAKKQSWHDKAAKTIVIKTEKEGKNET